MANVVLGNVGNNYFCSTSWYWKNRLLTGSFDCQNEHSWLPVLQIVLRRCSESYCMILITVFSGLSELFYSGLLLTLIFAQYSMADKFTKLASSRIHQRHNLLGGSGPASLYYDAQWGPVPLVVLPWWRIPAQTWCHQGHGCGLLYLVACSPLVTLCKWSRWSHHCSGTTFQVTKHWSHL